MFRILIALLRSTLWGIGLRGRRLTPEEFGKLMRKAEKQCLTGHVAQALMDNGIALEKHDAVECLATQHDVAEQNKKVNEALRALCQLLDEAQLRYVVVKGQTLLPLYRHGENRVSGDVDFYCPPDTFEQAKTLIDKAWHVEWEIDADEGFQHYAFEHEGISFEMHFCLKKFYSRRSQRYFDRLIADADYIRRRVGEMSVPVLPPHLEIAYTFLHLYHHLANKGVALRQFCDVAMLLHHRHYDAEKLKEVLRSVDHEKAFKAVGAVLMDVLGLPEEEVPYTLTEKDRRHLKAILQVVVRHGNFGFYGNKHRSRSGWKYYRESLVHKMQLLQHFYTLAPREMRNTLIKAIPQKIMLALKREK